jgi:hypothetical protein
MRKEYDFTGGKRGAVVPAEKGKTRITIRIDTAILNWFREHAHAGGGEGNYQTLINDALRAHVSEQTLETMMRRVVREELRRAKPKRTKRTRTTRAA